jgi:hypothetical protein
MVGDSEGEIRVRNAAAPFRDLTEGKKRSLMQEMPIDPDQASPVLSCGDCVGVPKLVDKGPPGL